MIYITVIALGWFLMEFEPFQILLDYIREKLPTKPIIDYIFGAFTCWQCMTFWSGWIYTGDILTAMIASLGSLILQTWMEKR